MDRTPWVKNPCRECEERTAECHGTCEAYAEFRKFVRLRKLGYVEFTEAIRPTHKQSIEMKNNIKRKAKGKR